MARLNIMPNPIRLHEFVALEEGYFEDEELEYEIEWKAFYDVMGRWGEYKERPQDLLFVEQHSTQEIATACHWGSINNASSGMGKWVPDAHQVSRHAIFVRPDSELRRPEDLADVPIGVGWLAGSHFNTYLRLEEFLPLTQIKPLNVGGYGARLVALLDGEVEAASLLDPQIYMADELGLRRIVSGEYEGLWWVDDDTDMQALRKFLNVMERAEKALQADLPKYLPLWERCIPGEFKDRDWAFETWGHGTRFVNAPYPREKFDKAMAEMERWGLDAHQQQKDFAMTSRSCVG
jgi:ABC-type nitrate/sulfonate/bicarbonate transport system substrate-binding protein